MEETKLSILVIDDNSYQREILGRYLRRDGHHVTFAQNGAQALAQLRGRRYDLMLLDLDMPVMSGFELLEIRQASAELLRIPVIIISGSGDRHLLRGLDLGAQDYLCKPLTPLQLAAKIHRCLERQAAMLAR